ncbi:tail fiber protein [Pectobacterium aroidearum]|uniref:phage tail protein n=1 Tax=Pectobacterium aroidearum TaxID=1201031 RepID=UPI00330734D1
MANLSEQESWIDGIYQLETSDPVVAGPGGISNRQAEQLASRTAYLKKMQETTGKSLQTHLAASDPHSQYAPKNSPALTGTPTAPTTAQTTNNTQIATTAFVKTAIAALINGSPAALDTLQELANALGNDPHFSTTILNAIADVKTDAANKLNAHASVLDAHPRYAPKDSPAFTGTPTAPTAASNSNNTQLATTAFVKAAVAALVNGSPAALDTLQELANALGNDPNFSTTILNALAGKLSLTGGKMSGRLETNDIVKVTGRGTELPDSQGAFLCWNRINGEGRTDFVNHRGSGGGGFSFWNGNHEALSELASLNSNGSLYVSGMLHEAGKRVYSPNNKPTPEDIGAYSKDEGDIRYLKQSGGEATGELQLSAANGLRLNYGDYGVIFRNDGYRFYILLTNKGDKKGSFNSLRPFDINLATGELTAGHNVNVVGAITEKGQRIYSPNNKPTSADVGAISINDLAGIPLPFPGAVAPTGWLKCNGQSFDKSRYPILASRYPSGVLPDLRGEFVRGWDDGRGADASRALLSAQGDAIRNIVGTIGQLNDRVNTTETAGVFDANKYTGAHSGLTGGNGGRIATFDASKVVPTAAENRPRNIAFNYIVRAA